MPHSTRASRLKAKRESKQLSDRKIKTTAPRIPMWSPTMVLTRRHSGLLRRSDGMRCFQSPMAVDKGTSCNQPIYPSLRPFNYLPSFIYLLTDLTTDLLSFTDWLYLLTAFFLIHLSHSRPASCFSALPASLPEPALKSGLAVVKCRHLLTQ